MSLPLHHLLFIKILSGAGLPRFFWKRKR